MKSQGVFFDKGTLKVIVFACLVIVVAVVVTGAISYSITRGEVVEKLKSRDMVYIISSISAKIDGRMERAKQTALVLAQDPTIIEWVAGAEKDERLGRHAKEKITLLARNYDYSNAFIVSAVTFNYWAEGGRKIDVMSKSDPDDAWFFDTIKSARPVQLDIDSNKERGDTFVFVNALMGDIYKPLAVVGVGMNLKELAREFENLKFGTHSNLWLIDGVGKIHLSEDVEHMGLYLNDFVPPELSERIVKSAETSAPQVVEYVNRKGEMMDLVYLSTRSTDWKLVFQMPRTESTALLANIQYNTTVAAIISLVLIVFIFYYVSDRIAHPLQRAILLTQEMEKLVSLRTAELAEQNQKVMDSIDYARRLQEAILPSAREMATTFAGHFVLWKPRDRVGGDFYWLRQLDPQHLLVAVVDCTGHGVPGAFMTMAVNSILDHIVATGEKNPATILQRLNRQVKETLHRGDPSRMADDGLDIGICCIEQNRRILFAGARIPLFVIRGGQVHILPASRKGLGYRRSQADLSFESVEWIVEPQDCFVMTTDGFLDQNGGAQDMPLGRKRFVEWLSHDMTGELGPELQRLEKSLAEYMGAEPQRDDIAVIGFRLAQEGDLPNEEI